MRLSKRFVLATIVLLFPLILLMVGCFKSAPKVYHVGILSGIDFFSGITDGFKEKMTELGYNEGTNIVYDIYKAPAPVGNQNAIKKFIDEKVDLIVVYPTEAAMEAKALAQGTGIPVVFVNVFTEGTGLINSIREPGGDITGVRWPGPDMSIKDLEYTREMVPHAKSVLIPYLKDYPIVNGELEALRKASKDLGFMLMEVPVASVSELQTALKKLADNKNVPDAIMGLADPLSAMPDTFITLAKFAQEHKIPYSAGIIKLGNYDAVYSYLPKPVPQGKQAAYLADKIFKGTPAGTIPVVSAECFITLNYNAFKKIGLKVPEGLLGRANEVIR